MPVSELKLIKRCVEFCEKTEVHKIPEKTRGIYVLLNKHKGLKSKYDVVYIGMARGAKTGMHGRLNSHARGRKKDKWTHFSIFEVWDNVRAEEVAELEGILRHVYRTDARANPLNEQRAFKKLTKVGKKTLEEWRVKQS